MSARSLFFVNLLLLSAGCTIGQLPLPETLRVIKRASDTGPFRAGAAVASITPKGSVEMAGFNIFRDSTGVHDELQARALIVERENLRIALVCLDLIGIQRGDLPYFKEGIEGVDADLVFLHCTHTHESPDTLGMWGFPPFWSGQDEEVFETVRTGIRTAIWEASKALRPAEFAAVRIEIDPKGIAKNLRKPDVLDLGLPVVHIREADSGDTIATLVSFGSHPEALGRGFTELSADYPFWLRSQVEEKLGGVCLFGAGALGAMVVPDVDPEADPVAEAARIGKYLGMKANQAITGIQRYDSSPPLSITRAELLIPSENLFFKMGRFFNMFHRDIYDGHLLTEVSLLRIGDLSIACVPGEITPDLGLAIQKELPGRVPMILGLVGDELGYLISPADFEDDRFDYEQSMSPAKSAGRRVVERLGELSGK